MIILHIGSHGGCLSLDKVGRSCASDMDTSNT
jgi:hypothetical protein